MLVALVALLLGSPAQAAPQDRLIQAYDDLATANHDYGGHRANAMKQVEEAGKILKIDLHGNAKTRERQMDSDAQLREARQQLETVRKEFSPDDIKRIDEHLTHAIREIDAALKTR